MNTTHKESNDTIVKMSLRLLQDVEDILRGRRISIEDAQELQIKMNQVGMVVRTAIIPPNMDT